MPRRKQPATLRTAAMTMIARNFDKLCYNCNSSHEMNDLVQSGKYLEISGPFTNLPSSILEGLIEELKHLTYLRRCHIHHLLTPGLTSLILSDVGDLHFGIDIITERCQKLRRLDLSYLRHIIPPVLVKLVQHIPLITSLNLKMTMANDQVLSFIGEHCPHLRELNLTSTPVTDRGLMALCMSKTGRPQCQKLLQLLVLETRVTYVGVAYCLEHLPNLREFDYEAIYQVFDHIDSTDLDLGLLDSLPRYKITSLCSNIDSINPDSIDVAIALCPYVQQVSIANAWLTNETLYKFMIMERLTKLSLTNNEAMTMSFNEGVLPLLSCCGAKLENLILNRFFHVDVEAIGQCCPVLQNLALSEVGEYENISKLTDGMFQNLQALEIWSTSTVDVYPVILRQLLYYCKDLQNLLFKGCDSVTDKLLADIWRANPMPKFCHVTIYQCHNITPSAVNQMLDMNNDITMLRIWCCMNITRQDSIQLSRRIKTENMDVYLEWFSYEG